MLIKLKKIHAMIISYLRHLHIFQNYKELDFYKSVPIPENIFIGDLSLQERQTNPNNWYDWNLTNLGTKWNVSDAYYTKNENEIIYEFETAWSPPTSWLEKTANKYPNLIFKMKLG